MEVARVRLAEDLGADGDRLAEELGADGDRLDQELEPAAIALEPVPPLAPVATAAGIRTIAPTPAAPWTGALVLGRVVRDRAEVTRKRPRASPRASQSAAAANAFAGGRLCTAGHHRTVTDLCYNSQTLQVGLDVVCLVRCC